MVHYFLEGFLAGPPSSVLSYIISIHTVPLTASLCLTAVLKFCEFEPLWSLLTLGTGVVATSVVFALQPLPILGPVGGRYNVGIVYLNGHRSQTMPPLAVYYPTAVVPDKKGSPYLPYNDGRFLEGISKYANLPGFLLSDIAFVRMRVTPNAEPLPLLHDGKASFPVAVFSHGLSGYHGLYSCFLADLAARGVIVVGIGHCDGSASFMRDGGSEDNEVSFKMLNWEVPVRERQLAIRVTETRQTLKRILGKEFWIQLGFEEKSIEKFIESQPPLHLVGHSFGGATVLATALAEENEKRKIASVVTFDPWYLTIQNEHFLQPILSGEKTYTTPTLMIHSEAWVNSKENWNFFKQATSSVLSQPEMCSMREDARRELFITETLGGINHLALSDVSVLSPFVHSSKTQIVPPRAQIVEFANSALQFVKRHNYQGGKKM